MVGFVSALRYWHWLLLVVLAGVSLLATEILVEHEQQLIRSQQLRHEVASAGQLKAMLESELNIPLYLTVGLASYVKASDGMVDKAELDILLPGLVEQAKHIRNIGVAPDNRLQYIYPLAGNERAINLYYPDLPDQWPAVAETIRSGQARLIGPIRLVQGGQAFIYRLPIFIPDDTYWGILSTVINIETIWSLLADKAAEQNVTIALRAKTPGQNEYGNSFFGEPELFYDDSLLLNLAIRGADWQMAIRATGPVLNRGLLLRVSLYAGTLCLLILLAWLFYSRQRLRQTANELSHSESYLRAVMDNVRDAIVVTSEDGIIEDANLSCFRLYGYPRDSLQGLHWSMLLATPQNIDEIYSATSAPEQEFEGLGLRQDSSQFELSLTRTRLVQGQQQQQLMLIRDITERKRIEKLKNDFVATVSHELRTPLTAINGALGLAIGGALGDLNQAAQKMLTMAHSSCGQLNQLINDLLDTERLASGKMRFAISEVALIPLLEQNITQIKAMQHQQRLVINQDNQKPYLVMADKGRLSQVCLNLLSNAVKFSSADSVVEIKLSEHGGMIRVSIIDQGKGVSGEFLPRLFQRFAQADNHNSRQHAGTGLGLAISKALIEQMDGNIGYQRLAQGSCFYFELPAAGALSD
ncbi:MULTISPECIES: ATP-binding protein [unclassified Arsukibacterium]|uniref:ATP-binding protein n=1 Tax=unclassified Arsukibacterium TaxID=2635278 RepID=UPI000C3CAF5D|nr:MULTISPECIES: ATP-binding protein [unclassified Arsukibacterium]MAA95010.1 PAS domain S-box protein [Rheinheimera sp.]MBM35376.1 PAS domain S-box protein [Rheinheimera sp.]HAW94531.1 PAS domain S-box protein [Candidatus Azambacteria bacterium]|tara:strand:+ start:160 stop:2079 length:1920 start_codon:yes stop_codon:yes gene_type:complete